MNRTSVSLGVLAGLLVGCSSGGDDAGDAGEGTSSVEVTSGPTAVGSTEPAAEPDPATSITTSITITTTTTAASPSSTAPAAPPESTTSPTSTTVAPADVLAEPVPASELELVVYPVPDGSRPHDVAPAADGGVWYTAQRAGALGHLDPTTGATRHIPLGPGSAPHGVIVGEDGRAWITDGGLNAIVSVDPADDSVAVFPLPPEAPDANLNTAVFDGAGRLWFTGQNGFYGVLDTGTGTIQTFPAPRGRGPYGITATPDGDVYYASLAGSYVGSIAADGSVVELEPPTPAQGARRVWADSTGAIWVSEWNSGQLSRFTPATAQWDVWPLPGDDPAAYAVYVDDADDVWVTDFGGNAIHRFRPARATFETFPLPATPGEVRQLLGRGAEVWGAQSADDSLVVIRPT